jgi:hypothetical protein
MENDLSLTDIYMIQALLKKNSYEEISDLIDKPVQLIKDYADQFAKDQNKISKQSILDKKAVVKKSKQERRKKINQEKEDDKARELAIKKRKIENRRQQLQKTKRVEKFYQTRQENLLDKICVKIDHKTTVFVNPGTNIPEFKKRFLERMNKSKEILKPKKSYTEVKKFKPLK